MPPARLLSTGRELAVSKAATPAPPMVSISKGRAPSTTPMLPPDMMKLPNTQPNSTTMPIIWNKGFSRRSAEHRRYCLISRGQAFQFAQAGGAEYFAGHGCHRPRRRLGPEHAPETRGGD